MAEIYDCVTALKALLNIEYEFLIARKGCQIAIKLIFEKVHFFHLMGLHYVRDVRELNAKAAQVFDELYNHKIQEERILASPRYKQIAERIHFLRYLEKIIDDNETVFKYNEHQNAFSLIRFDFLLQNSIDSRNVFLFLAKKSENTYFCRSFFPQDKYDYSIGQTKWTLLSKKKRFKSTGEEIVLYTKA